MSNHGWVLPAAILLPLVAAPLAHLLAGRRLLQTWLGLAALEISTLLCLWLISLTAGGQVGDVPLAATTVLSVEFSLRLTVDGLNAPFLLVVALVGLASAVFYATRYEDAPHRKFHLPVLLLSTAAVGGVLASGNLLTLYVFWQLALLCLVLAVVAGLGEHSLAGAVRYFVVSELAVLLLLFAVGVDYARGPTYALAGWAVADGGPQQPLMLALLLAAGLVGVAASPLHGWLAYAGRATEPMFAPFFYGVQNKIGLYLLARALISQPADFALAAWAMPLAALGALTVGVAGANALAQRDLRGLVAFLAVGQTGYVLMGLGAGERLGLAGGLFLVLSQTVALVLVLLSVEVVRLRAGTDDPYRLGGLARRLPLAAVGFTVGALSLVGVPPWTGFIGQALIYHGALSFNEALGVLLTLAGLLGSTLMAAALARLGGQVFLGERAEGIPFLRPPDGFAQMSVGGLLGCVIALGIAPRLLLDPLVSPIAGLQFTGEWADLAVVSAAGAPPLVVWNSALSLLLLGLPMATVILARALRAEEAKDRPARLLAPVASVARRFSPRDEAAPPDTGEPMLITRLWLAWHGWAAAGNLDPYIVARRLLLPSTRFAAAFARLTLRLLLR